MASSFGIGLYQPFSGGTLYQQGFPNYHTDPTILQHPWSGIYGGTYGYAIDTTIYPPKQVTYTPPASIGIDTLSNVVVRGYPQISWSWTTMRPDRWYQLFRIRQMAARTPLSYQYLVLLQYPDPLQDGGITQVLARFEPLTHSSRDGAAYYDVAAKFSYVGQLVLEPSVPIQVIA